MVTLLVTLGGLEPLCNSNDLGKIPTESPPTGAPNRGGVGENGDFRPIFGYISQTVQNRDTVTMEH